MADTKVPEEPRIPDTRMPDERMPEEQRSAVSRRAFIKGVIAAGATVSSASYLFRAATLSGQPATAGTVERLLTLNVNGQQRRVDVLNQETLA